VTAPAPGRAAVRLTGSIEVARPPREAFNLFTPEGERAWAHGWNPGYPSPPGDRVEPGLVFVTRHGGQTATWVVAAVEPGRAITYAQVITGERAGLISVLCRPATAGTTVVVSYELTALSAGADEALRRFAAGYEEFLAHWERAIATLTG
jgi:Polyketide cyclase / dehydrase and lipid transport